MSKLHQCPFEDAEKLLTESLRASHMLTCAKYEEIYESGVSIEPENAINIPPGDRNMETATIDEFDVYAVKLALDKSHPDDEDLLETKLQRLREWRCGSEEENIKTKEASLKKAYAKLNGKLKRLLYIGESGRTLQTRVEEELRDAMLFWFLPYVPPYTLYLLVAMQRVVDELGPNRLFPSYVRYGERNIEAYLLAGGKTKKEGEQREVDCIYAYNPLTLANLQRPSLTTRYGVGVIPSEARQRGAKLISAALNGAPTTKFNPFFLLPTTMPPEHTSSGPKMIASDIKDYKLSVEDYKTMCRYTCFRDFRLSPIVKQLWDSAERVREKDTGRHLLPNPLRDLFIPREVEQGLTHSPSIDDLIAWMETMPEDQLRYIHQSAGGKLKLPLHDLGLRRGSW